MVFACLETELLGEYPAEASVYRHKIHLIPRATGVRVGRAGANSCWPLSLVDREGDT